MPTRWLALAALLIAAYGAALGYEMFAAPAGCCALTWPNPDPAQAERLLARSDPQGRSAPAQRQAAVDMLRARPGEPTGWLRLAYADRLAGGRLSAAGVRDLDTSYLIAPYGGLWAPWRISFALDNWTAVTPAIRKDVMAEIGLAASDGGASLEAVKAAARTVRDPWGRPAAVLLGLIPAATPAP